MDLSQESFYIVVFIAVAFNLLFVVLVVAYIRLVKKHLELQRKFEQYSTETDKVLAKAQKEAEGIITQAHNKASSIISETTEFSKHYEKQMAGEITAAESTYKKQYEKALKQVQEESIKMIQNISNEVNSQFASNREEFKKEMIDELAKVKKIVEASLSSLMQDLSQAIDYERSRARDEFQAQRNAKLVQLDKQVTQSVSKIVKEVLDSGITIRDQDKLVKEALDQAKKEGRFEGM